MTIPLTEGRKIELIKIIKKAYFIRSKCWYFNGFKLDLRTKFFTNSNVKVERNRIYFPIDMLIYDFFKKMNLVTFYFKIEISEPTFK